MRKKKSGGGGANWMDTYGDMVTLLLCFFVLLYSMSEVNQEKWEAVVKSFNPDAVDTNVAGGTENTDTAVTTDAELPTEETVEQAMTELYEKLKDYIEQNNLQNQIELTKGAGYVYITFDDTVFFGGDSYVLLDSGKQMLNVVAAAIAEEADLIDQIQVQGHTSQGSPTTPNNPTTDRFLSSNRAATVLVYLQEKNVIDPAKLVSVGYGQWRPIAGFDTAADRAKNRRVELVITGIDPEGTVDSIERYYEMRDGNVPQGGN